MSMSVVVFTTSTQQHLAQQAEAQRRRHHASIVAAMMSAGDRAFDREWESRNVGHCTACGAFEVRLNKPVPVTACHRGQRNHGYGCEVCD